MKHLLILSLLVVQAFCDDSTTTAAVPTDPATTTIGQDTESTVSELVDSTTAQPLVLSTFAVSNNVDPLDAKSILQHALQLENQINDLNNNLKSMKANTDVNNSPLFTQLFAFSQQIADKNSTLQNYIAQLNTLSSKQDTIDTRTNAASNTFTCFAQSSCVTDVPTTPEPTTAAPTPSATPCTNTTLTATNTKKNYNFDTAQNAAQCAVSITAANNVNISISVTISGPNAFVDLVETRSRRTQRINATTSSAVQFSGLQQVDVVYFSDRVSTVQFQFDYVQTISCGLDCQNGGACKVSQSGQEYCECPKCAFSGDLCETPVDPCGTKQNRTCGGSAYKTNSYGTCYLNGCYDGCYACACKNEDPENPQSCLSSGDNTVLPTPPSLQPVCDTTLAPTTTALLLTSTAAGSTATGAAQTTTGSAQTAHTGQAGQSTDASQTTVTSTPNVEASTATPVITSTAPPGTPE